MLRLAFIACAVLAVARPGAAAPPGPAPGPAPITAREAAGPPDELGRGTPHGSVAGFLAATSAREYDRAAGYLNLTRIPAARGATLARKLRVVIDNAAIDINAVPDDPKGRPEAGMLPGRQLVGRVAAHGQMLSIVLERVPRDDGILIWQFSASTVARIPDLYWQFSYGVVGKWVPAVLVETRVLSLALWQWIGQVVLLAASLGLAVLLVRPTMPITRWILSRWRVDIDDPAFRRAVGPLRALIAVGLFSAGQVVLALPIAVMPVVTTVEKLALVLSVTWLAARLVEGSCLLHRRRLLARHEPATLPMIDFAQRAANIVLVLLAVLVLLQAVGVRIGALIAAVGVGGIGLALAAQRIVENLFSGLVVIGDQPVRVGDFCHIGNYRGTVERIGLWSTRVRTPERSVVSIPNSQFLLLHVENLQRRDRMLFETTLRLRYDTTPDQLRRILAGLRKALRAHPHVDPDPARVCLTRLGPESLDVEVFAYLRTLDADDFLVHREELYLCMMDVAAAAGTAFALPARVNDAESAGLDRDKGAAAAAEGER